ncbi:MAG TPA: type III pantothenate kinase [Clostridiaceae bacterium]|mgnify:CR=1 FL=1|nr:type III pantothenate kinase [Clostridiaceae bacterium]
MLMTIDIGNTKILFGVFHGEDLVARFRINSRTERSSDELAILLIDLLRTKHIKPADIKDVIISSVVPKIQDSFKRLFQNYFDVEILTVGPEIETGIIIKAENPKEVGADRIVNVVAAHSLYEGSTMVIDFGTATTFDYVDQDGVFQYTVIMPGVEISAQALHLRTAKLPQVEIKKPESILANNTVSGMHSGIFFGYIGAVEHIIRRMMKELNDRPNVISTGGLGRLFYENSDLIDAYNPNIAFEGMKIIFKCSKNIKGDLAKN